MQTKVNILFDLVTPFRLCSDLSLSIKSKGTSCFVEDPITSNEIYITEADFVGKQINSNFQFGNIVDFLVYVKKISYDEAIDWVLDEYLSKLDNPLLNSIVWARKSISTYLEDIAHINSRLLTPTDQNIGDPETAKGRSFLEGYDLTEANAARLLTINKGHTIKQIFSELKSPHIRPKLNSVKDEAIYLVLPYFASYHLPAVIDLHDVVLDKKVSINLVPCKHAFFGLRSSSPESLSINFFKNSSEVLNYYSNFLRHGDLKSGCVAAKTLPDGNISTSKLNRATMVFRPQETALSTIVKNLTHVRDLRLIYESGLFATSFEDAVDARRFVLNDFVSKISRTGKESQQIVKYVDMVHSDNLLFESVKEELKTKGRADILEDIGTFFRETRPIEIKGYQIFTTRDGYMAKNKNSNQTFTNFSIKLDKTLMFRDSSDIYYKGSVYSGDRSFPLLISKKESQRANEIINAATSAVASSLDNENDVRVPTLLDSTFNKHLPNILAHEINNTQVEVGLNQLGWSKNKTYFQAVGWRASTAGMAVESKEMHPGEAQLKLFSDTAPNEKENMYSHPASNTLLAILAAYLCRSYLDLPTPPLKIKNTNCNQQLLKEITTPFGQQKILEVNANVRSSNNYLNTFSGYPLLCSCVNPHVVEAMNSPIFLLHEDGRILRNADVDLEKLKSFAEWLFPKLIHHILLDGATWFNDLSLEREKFTNLIFEGANVIKKILNLKLFPVEDFKFPMLYQYLSEEPGRGRPHGYSGIKFSLKDQAVRIETKHYSTTMPELLKEFKDAGIECYPHPNRVKRSIFAPSGKILDILSDYYGKAPILEPFEFDEPGEAEVVKSKLNSA